MTLNRRHKAVLFVTLVAGGCALLLDVELRTVLGLAMLGVAFAWAVGSDTASRMYAGLKDSSSGTFYSWVRLPLAMALAGGLLGAVLLYTQANPVAVVVVMSAAGIFLAPLTQLPTRKAWLNVPLVGLGAAALLFATFGVISTDLIASNKYAERFGQLSVTGFLTFIIGLFWLSKGWHLIGQGVTSCTADPVSPGIAAKKPWGHYVSLFLGITVLTLWLSLLAWSASGDWEYAPEKVIKTEGSNLFTQLVFVVLLASWPYFAWKKILQREPNTEPKFLRRHRRTSAIAGMLFVIVFSLAVTYGIQNGDDRRMVEKIEAVVKNLTDVGAKISAIKQRDLQTTADYILAYAEIEQLLPDYEAKLKDFSAAYQEASRIDERRGLINTQLFYKSHKPNLWKNNLELIELLRQSDSLTREEALVARNMASIPTRNQADFWEREFRPLLAKEDDLRVKLQTVSARIQTSAK